MIKMSADYFRMLREEYAGICTTCHAERYETEPDAEDYECESCGTSTVQGIENLLVCGEIYIESSYLDPKDPRGEVTL